ncbi:hypothetical protein FNL37_1799 [Methylovorus glucosotrophus]|uniref:hypothetical protein n=1 Tax=Methylovorus glucosotrophus TaxID=266009 RepID=UPI0013316802|nr:hypothetical protein [Methylovorus glucosotrophus]KAF0844355.1 hypothetical protein FNL37_1799 [Methylovorus glucosotrophus]
MEHMRKIATKVLDFTARTSKTLSPAEYITFSANSRNQIKRVKFVAPKLGSEGFGKFEVELSSPVYEMEA